MHIVCTVRIYTMHGSKKFCQRGSNSGVFLFVCCYLIVFSYLMRREKIQIPLKAGHHRPASETSLELRVAGGSIIAKIECWLGSFVIFQGIQTSIAKKSNSIVIKGGGGLLINLSLVLIKEIM